MELMRLISVYAALHVLMMCCFIERSLSKMKSRMRTVPVNSTSVLLREIVWQGCVDRGMMMRNEQLHYLV